MVSSLSGADKSSQEAGGDGIPLPGDRSFGTGAGKAYGEAGDGSESPQGLRAGALELAGVALPWPLFRARSCLVGPGPGPSGLAGQGPPHSPRVPRLLCPPAQGFPDPARCPFLCGLWAKAGFTLVVREKTRGQWPVGTLCLGFTHSTNIYWLLRACWALVVPHL